MREKNYFLSIKLNNSYQKFHLYFTTGVYQSRVVNNRLTLFPESKHISFEVTCDWLGFNEDIHKKTRHDFILRIVFKFFCLCEKSTKKSWLLLHLNKKQNHKENLSETDEWCEFYMEKNFKFLKCLKVNKSI